MNTDIFKSNPLLKHYNKKTGVILLAHSLIGSVRGKSANGLMIHNELLKVVAIVDKEAPGKMTSEECLGVTINIPIYCDVKTAVHIHKAKAIVILVDPLPFLHTDIKIAILNKLDIINTSFRFIKDIPSIKTLAEFNNVKYFDLRDVIHQQGYPNTEIVNRGAKVIYVTGTDCGLGKRTASFELLLEARKRGVNATMYATGQTGLMLGIHGTVVDSLITEFSNGIVSQHICQLSEQGYDIIFVEGQSDIFHPANSAMALALLHGANPDGVILVHDHFRKFHQGFEKEAELYRMHSLNRYIETLKMLSLPCGPEYKTIGIATIGQENIKNIRKILPDDSVIIEDARTKIGRALLFDIILKHCNISCERKEPVLL